MRIAVGMSGGVDSSAAAALLNESHDTVGITLSLCSAASKDAADAKTVCDKLGIPHRLLDLQDTFSRLVIDNFVDEYIAGRTPNPCIQCNRHIKFGAMLDFARSIGCDKIATGHYARVEKCGGRYLLKKALDTSKDQSYVLYCLTCEQLSRIELPLGGYTKPQIREIAESRGLITAHKSDSQDICFVPDGDYAAFITRRAGREFPKGDYVNQNGEVLGQHQGVIHYTVGQRKGLGIAMGHPVFVLSKDAQTHRVVLGEEQSLFYRRVLVDEVNFITDSADTMRATAKLRYRHTEQPCVIHRTAKNQVIIEFSEPQRAPAPGQAAVFYDGEYVLGGGTIVKGVD